jgi:hypothetical protein
MTRTHEQAFTYFEGHGIQAFGDLWQAIELKREYADWLWDIVHNHFDEKFLSMKYSITDAEALDFMEMVGENLTDFMNYMEEEDN